MKHRTQGSFIFSSFLLLISSASMCSNMQSNEASIDTFLPVFMSDYPSQKSFDGMINCEKPKKNNWQNPSSPDKTEFMTPSPEPIPFYDDNADGYFTPAIIPYIPGTPAEHLIPLVQRFEHAYSYLN